MINKLLCSVSLLLTLLAGQAQAAVSLDRNPGDLPGGSQIHELNYSQQQQNLALSRSSLA